MRRGGDSVHGSVADEIQLWKSALMNTPINVNDMGIRPSYRRSVLPMRHATAPARAGFAVLLAFVLAFRLLTPTGYMPTFDQGRLTVIECPGSSDAPMSLMPGMSHDHGKTCQNCPHATATGAGLAAAPPLAIAATVFSSIALVVWREFAVRVAGAKYERPPAIGPPVSA